MGILNEFERRLERVIEGVFTKAFRTGLQPVELANRILREMEAGKTVGVREVWVPNRYVFKLSAPDTERFQEAAEMRKPASMRRRARWKASTSARSACQTCFPRASPICWSMDQTVSQWVWRRRFRRTI